MERFYLTRETVRNNLWIIVKDKQKKTIELVHNSTYYTTSYFTGQVKSL